MKLRNIVTSISAIFVISMFAAMSARSQTVTGSIANGTAAKGVAARATIVLDIPDGLHVNSNRPNNEYQIPTTVQASAPGVKIGTVTYPRGRSRKFEFTDKPINVYEGRTTFTFNVTVPRTYTGNSVSIRVKVRYQACTTEVCYPPKTKEVTLSAKLR